jgi:hypothetical protein
MSYETKEVDHSATKSPGLASTDVYYGETVPVSVDAALQYLRNEGGIDDAQINEKALLRKIDMMVLPLMLGVYIAQFLDKSLSK